MCSHLSPGHVKVSLMAFNLMNTGLREICFSQLDLLTHFPCVANGSEPSRLQDNNLIHILEGMGL